MARQLVLVSGAPAAGKTTSCHPVHVTSSVSPEFLAEFDRPVGVGELIVVDTTIPVDVEALADEVRRRLAGAGEHLMGQLGSAPT